MARSGQKQMMMNTFSNRTRERIKCGKIVKRVQACALGQVEMTSVELQAAKLLINKLIPDATADPSAVRDVRDISAQSPHQLLSIIEGKAERTG